MPQASLLQKALLALFFGLLLVPGGTLIVRRMRHGQWDATGLVGTTVKPELPIPRVDAWRKGKLQSEFSTWYNAYFGQRRRLVTTYNQFLYSVFRVSHMNGENLRVGPHDWLFEQHYLEDYFNVGPLGSEKALADQADAISLLHRTCQIKGVCFTLVISPSKAAFYPEEAPSWYQKRGVRRERDYDRFLSLLKDRGVPVVDGHAILTQRRTLPACPPFFPKGRDALE